MYRDNFYYQFRTMLLDDVSSYIPKKRMDIYQTTSFSTPCQPTNNSIPHAYILYDGKYEYFRNTYCKSFVSFIIFGTYMQVTHTYDITGKVKTLARNRKLVQKNKQ